MNLTVRIAGAFILFTTVISYGQKSSDNVSREICKCIDAKLSAISDNANLKDSVRACFGKGMATDINGLLKEYKIKGNSITIEQIREVGARLSRKLEQDCETFKKIVSITDHPSKGL